MSNDPSVFNFGADSMIIARCEAVNNDPLYRPFYVDLSNMLHSKPATQENFCNVFFDTLYKSDIPHNCKEYVVRNFQLYVKSLTLINNPYFWVQTVNYYKEQHDRYSLEYYQTIYSNTEETTHDKNNHVDESTLNSYSVFKLRSVAHTLNIVLPEEMRTKKEIIDYILGHTTK